MSAAISKIVLKSFAENHIARLAANNPGGAFTAMLVAVTDAYNAYFGDLVSASTNAAAQKGKSEGMRQSREALVKLISEDERLITYTYREQPGKYELFYPGGMTEYYQADLGTLETISARFKKMLLDHSADFDAAFVQAVVDAQATFVANREAQLRAFGTVADKRSSLVGRRKALARQLTFNLLGIAQHFLGNETKCEVYFDTSITNAAFRKSANKVKTEIAARETQVVFKALRKPSVAIHLHNNGNTALRFGFAASAGDALSPETSIVLQPGEKKSTTAAHLGYATNKRLLQAVNEGNKEGRYEAEKW